MICVYHRYECKQYHFVYALKEKQMVGDVTVSEIKGATYLNFPIKSFYSSVLQSVFVYYRQGHCFTINPVTPKECRCEKITDADLGSMFLLFDQALIVRSSSSILFFKINPET